MLNKQQQLPFTFKSKWLPLETSTIERPRCSRVWTEAMCETGSIAFLSFTGWTQCYTNKFLLFFFLDQFIFEHPRCNSIIFSALCLPQTHLVIWIAPQILRCLCTLTTICGLAEALTPSTMHRGISVSLFVCASMKSILIIGKPSSMLRCFPHSNVHSAEQWRWQDSAQCFQARQIGLR